MQTRHRIAEDTILWHTSESVPVAHPDVDSFYYTKCSFQWKNRAYELGRMLVIQPPGVCKCWICVSQITQSIGEYVW